jgi:stage II sporulation protein M
MKKIKKEKIKKSFNLPEEYKKSWNYIKKSKNYIFLIIGIFLLFSLIGFFAPAPLVVSEKIMDYLRGILAQTKGMSQWQIIYFIISNNVQSSFFGILFGMILGIFPVINALANGYILGFVAMISVKEVGFLSLLKLLPHGIFELPAVLISLGMGLKFGTFVFKKRKLSCFKAYLINSLRVFLLIIIPLLLIAGIIEGTLISLG